MNVNKPLPQSTGPAPVKSISVDANNRVTESPAKPDKTAQPVAPPPKDNKDSVGTYPQSKGPVSSITLCAVKPEAPATPDKPRLGGGSNIVLCAVGPDGVTIGQPKPPKAERPDAPAKPEKPRFDVGPNIISCAVMPDGSTIGQTKPPKQTKD